MQLGMIGLGRMGANMTARLMRAGHECIVYDSHPEPVQVLVMRKRRLCVIPNSTATSSTSLRSPRSGGAAALSAHGCWILLPRPYARIQS
jgi:6-phosphogluconate dehydrogenase (decarboxylating)